MLFRSEKAVARLVQKGELAGTKQNGVWSFTKEAIDQWLASHDEASVAVSEQQLSPAATGVAEPLTVASALSPLRMNFNLMGADKDSVLRELTALVVPPSEKRMFTALFKALKAREDMCTTCVNEGVAMPHSRNAIVGLVDRPIIAYGKHVKGVDYGAFDGKPVNHFFLLCAPNVRHHLQILARLARLLQNPQFRTKLNALSEADDLLALVNRYEPQPT